MWILLLIPLAIVTGSEILNEDCSLPVHAVCRSSDTPRKFPSTTEELDDFCDDLTEFLECAVTVEERCQFKPDTVVPARIVLSTVKDVCDKDNHLYAAFENNLQCISEFSEERVARKCALNRLDEEQINELIEDLVDQGVVNSENGHNMKECLGFLHEAACVAVTLEESCGEDPKELFLEVVRRLSGVLTEGCSDEIEAFLPAIVSMYKLEVENGNFIDSDE